MNVATLTDSTPVENEAISNHHQEQNLILAVENAGDDASEAYTEYTIARARAEHAEQALEAFRAHAPRITSKGETTIVLNPTISVCLGRSRDTKNEPYLHVVNTQTGDLLFQATSASAICFQEMAKHLSVPEDNAA